MKLLNEYQKKLNRREENKRNYEIYERELKDDNIRMNDLDDPYEGLNMYGGYAKARLISKQFGFIKRLVDNDKIDFEKADADISKDIVLGREPDFADFMVYRRFLDEEKVLMLLSIQDEPVKFLSEILKYE